MQNIPINITHTPFSRYGAQISITKQENAEELVLHNTYKPYDDGPTLLITFGDEQALPFSYECDPEKLTVTCSEGTVRMYIRDDQTLVVESFGPSIHFRMPCRNGYGVDKSGGHYRVISVEQKLYVDYQICEGNAVLAGPIRDRFGTMRDDRKEMHVSCVDGHALFAVAVSERIPAQIQMPIDPETDMEVLRREWEDFLAYLPAASGKDTESEAFYQMTWYNLWSCYVHAVGNYQYDVMLMSKKFMSSVWSWDHCFNALAMAKISKERAMEQFLAPFLLQLDNGALPDSWNPYIEIIYGVTKPPIHGWCFSKLMDQYTFSSEELEQVFRYLVKWTNYWMIENDSDQDGIPEYPQGCDSGWDNSSLFDDFFFVESPDLCAYLIIQMYTLSRIAETICTDQPTYGGTDWSAEAAGWKAQAQTLTERFYAHSWNGARFVGKESGTHRCNETPTSLITLMPLVMGKYLDEEKKRALIAILKKDFLTENGVATEKVGGSKYDPDGYWRGPIWAPTTYLLADGLRAGGEEELASYIAERYCRMSSHLANGHYENFDALTGKGLRAPGYTWSASVYMLLKWEFEQ